MNKNALNLGIVFGITSILLFLLMAIIDGGMILMSLFGLLGIVLAIVLPVIYIRKERSANGGHISFGEAFKVAFVGLIIGGLIGILFQMLYINVIDTEYAERMTMKSLEISNQFMEGNMPDDQREEFLREAEEDSRAQFTPIGQLKTFGIALIIYAIISAILAAILKRTPQTETLD